MPGWPEKKSRIDWPWGTTTPSPGRTALSDIAVHDPGQPLDHLQAGDVTLQLRDTRQHVPAQAPVDLPELAPLLLAVVLQVRRHAVLPFLVLVDHAVDDVAPDGHVELGEHLGGLAGVDKD